jgi:rhamnosyltransferase subunit B
MQLPRDGRMHVILIPIGTAGDVYPFLGLGEEFLRRGHRVTALCNAHFRPMVEAAGMAFAPLAGERAFNHMMDHPMMWHPTRALQYTAEHVFVPAVPVVYDFLKQHYAPGRTVAVAASLAWGALIAQESFGVPVVTAHLQPALMGSRIDPPVMAGMEWTSRLPLPCKRAMGFVGDRITDRILAPGINRFRRSLGLKPIRNVLRTWTHSPVRVLGLFENWFTPPQPDWPVGTQLSGFPLYDAGRHAAVPPAVERFLAEGPPPVVFTAGSGMRQARWLFESCVEACRRLGCRGLLLSPFMGQVPDLPPGILAAPYAPFSRIFPRAAAAVHHGGIGTLALALEAGIPQLFTPFAHDHFDNAARGCRLGVGSQILPLRYQARPGAPPGRRQSVRWNRDFTEQLQRLLEDRAMHARAREVARRLDRQEAIRQACDLVLDAAQPAWGEMSRSAHA